MEEGVVRQDEQLLDIISFRNRLSVVSVVPADLNHEISETKLPAGYIQTDDGKFYIQAINGVIKILTKDAEKVITEWEERTLSQQDKLEFDASTITVTVGNTPGAALPNTGGSGTNLFTALGGLMTATAGVILTLRLCWRRKEHYC